MRIDNRLVNFCVKQPSKTRLIYFRITYDYFFQLGIFYTNQMQFVDLPQAQKRRNVGGYINKKGQYVVKRIKKYNNMILRDLA